LLGVGGGERRKAYNTGRRGSARPAAGDGLFEELKAEKAFLESLGHASRLGGTWGAELWEESVSKGGFTKRGKTTM